MIGVYQTKPNNCVAACMATILGCRIEQIPDFNPACWAVELQAWLNESGWSLMNMSGALPQGITLGAVTIPGLQPGWKHCVVCEGGKVIWCPISGNQPGTVDAEEFTLIYPLNLEKHCAFQVNCSACFSLCE